MGLLQQRPTTIGEAFNHIGLPQWPRPIHSTTNNARHLFSELVSGAGRGETNVANVEVEIEVRVFNPIRPIEFERHLNDLASEWFEVAHHDPEPLANFRKRIEVRRRPLINRQSVDMAIGIRCFHQQKADVHPG